MTKDNFMQSLQSVNLKGEEANYNFLDVIKKVDNENIISEWLAFLFDAKKCGSALPLKNFCNYIDIDLVGSDVEIEREYTLDNRRRIDILIKLENAWIVIENKINSAECNEQTVDYELKIRNETIGQNVSLKYVYLKPTYNKSNPTNKVFNIMTYGELVKIWGNINKDDFIPPENHVYFSEFMKLIQERYAMSKELQFDENTKLYIQYSQQFSAVENSFNASCQVVKEKLVNKLNNIFTAEEGWVISFHAEYIQFYKAYWGSELHFEIGTWPWQRSYKNVSFNRLIANDVEIQYCLHAERKQAEIYGAKFKDIETNNGNLFSTKHYNFDNEDNCIASLNDIAERLQRIKDVVAPIIDDILTADK